MNPFFQRYRSFQTMNLFLQRYQNIGIVAFRHNLFLERYPVYMVAFKTMNLFSNVIKIQS